MDIMSNAINAIVLMQDNAVEATFVIYQLQSFLNELMCQWMRKEGIMAAEKY
jgi:hypothetical protein